MTQEENQKKFSDLFGVDYETVQLSKKILPTLNLGKLKEGSRIKIEFTESCPRMILTPNNPYGAETAKVINVKEISLGDTEEQGALEYSMFLSSKSLAMGVAVIYDNNNFDLKGCRAVITVSTAEYKNYGENRCYIVQEIKQENDNCL